MPAVVRVCYSDANFLLFEIKANQKVNAKSKLFGQCIEYFKDQWIIKQLLTDLYYAYFQVPRCPQIVYLVALFHSLTLSLFHALFFL